VSGPQALCDDLHAALELAARASGADAALLLDAGVAERQGIIGHWPDRGLPAGAGVPAEPLRGFAREAPAATAGFTLPSILLSACEGRPAFLWQSPALGRGDDPCRLLLAWRGTPARSTPLSAAAETLNALLQRAARPAAPLSAPGLLLAVLEEIPHGVVFVDDDARTVALSPAAAELIGSPGHRLAPAAFAELMRGYVAGADNAEEAAKQLALNGADDQPRSAELRRGGSRIYVQHRPLHLAQASGRVWIIADVTHDRLRERQLLAASRMELVTRITGGVAHEFNNLLMRITAAADLLLEDSLLEDRARGYLESILRASEHGAELVRRLLTYSRRRVMAAETLDPVAALGDISALVRSNLPRHLHLDTELPDSAPAVSADPALLETSVLALALNAMEAMEAMEAPGTLTLALTCSAAGEVAFTVRDGGIGMTPDVLARAREPFFSARREGFGTGLGLSMADGFARESGGRLELESTPGAGTTARLILPAGSAAG